MELRCGKPACPKLRLLIRLCAQKNVSVESFIEVENGRTQIVENKNSSSLSYEQNKVVFSGCANTDLGQQKRGTRPAGSQQQMALCNSIVSAASLRRKDLPVIGGSAGRWRFRHDAEIDNGIDLVELSPSLSTRMEICDPEIAVLLAIFRISGARGGMTPCVWKLEKAGWQQAQNIMASMHRARLIIAINLTNNYQLDCIAVQKKRHDNCEAIDAQSWSGPRARYRPAEVRRRRSALRLNPRTRRPRAAAIRPLHFTQQAPCQELEPWSERATTGKNDASTSRHV